VVYPGTVELAAPLVYSILDFAQPVNAQIGWQGRFVVEKNGTLNAMRFVTKNILAVVPERSTTIDWLNHYMTLPLANPVVVQAGDVLQVSFQYRAGGSIPSLQAAIVAELVFDSATAGEPARRQAAFA
jgi:protein arginine N-methyltransferase 1